MLERFAYQGWKNCYRLSNGLVDLVITGDVGPRIIRFGFVGEENEFYENAGMLGLTGGDEWRIYGGHRLWHAPEERLRTYVPDNSPVQVSEEGDCVVVTQPTEALTAIQKQLEIRLSADSTRVWLTHRLTNHHVWPVEIAAWAVTALAPGGVAILPLPPRGPQPENLQPTSAAVLWPYTDMADPRWRWGSRYVMLRHDVRAASPQKAGAISTGGWAACARAGRLFIKRFDHLRGVTYPDLGCTVETYADDALIELETLGPLVTLAPGASLAHDEQWFLLRDVPTPRDDDEIDRHVLPRIKGLIE